jgi:hypothetical protein
MLGTIAKKYIKTTAKKEASKKASRKAAEKNVGKEAADVTKPADTSPLGREYKGKVSEGEIPETAKYGSPRKKFKNKLDKLQYDYDGLTPSAKRAERMKGSDSKYYEVFKARNMTAIGKNKKVISPEEVRERLLNRKAGGSMKVKSYKKGGKIGRGCGAALRGGGKVMKLWV